MILDFRIGLALLLIISAFYSAYSASLSSSTTLPKSKLPTESDITSRIDNEVTIIGTADGVIHGVDSTGKIEKWSLSTGGMLLQSHQVLFSNISYASRIFIRGV